jgi:hypothetical protein
MRFVTLFFYTSRLGGNRAKLPIHRLWITLWTNCEPEVDSQLTAPSLGRLFERPLSHGPGLYQSFGKRMPGGKNPGT